MASGGFGIAAYVRYLFSAARSRWTGHVLAVGSMVPESDFVPPVQAQLLALR